MDSILKMKESGFSKAFEWIENARSVVNDHVHDFADALVSHANSAKKMLAPLTGAITGATGKTDKKTEKKAPKKK